MEHDIISAEGISVRYPLTGDRPRTAQEYLIGLVNGKVFRGTDFWALHNVSFALKRGESLGIIGSNGSGKSTLLKVVAGIITPSTGTVSVRGKLAPLIELGAGFDPELTGEENIYLNASILGLSRREISSKLKKIVEFSEVENFIFSPLRTYSSGMLARLAFSIAVEVEADVLVVDEVLSVGDEGFRKKCHYRIDEIIRNGTTLLYVSHSMGEVQRLCRSALWIESGKAMASGDSDLVSRKYLLHFDETAFRDIPSGHPYKKEIDAMFLHGITSGYIVNGERYYNPNNKISRAEFSVFLSKALNVKKFSPARELFADVPAGHWASAFILWTYEQGLIDAVKDEKGDLYYYPDDYITAEELTKILDRIHHGKWEDIVSASNTAVDRGEMARIFYQFFEYEGDAA